MKTRTNYNLKKALFVGGLSLLLSFSFLSCEDNELVDLLEDTNMDNGNPDDAMNLVTYENTVKGIMDNACIQCHGATNANGDIRLHTYQNVKAVAETGRLLIRMTSTSDPMPPSGNLPAPIIQDVMDWIDDGLLEN